MLLVLAPLLAATACGGDKPTMMGLPFSSYTHEDEPFAQELFEEQAVLPQVDDDELVVMPGDYDAAYTHVDEYARAGLDTPGDGPTVWFLGGSTLFGIGQRDEHMIPSEIARLAEADGSPVEVVTFGFPSWASWQEAGLLSRLLAEREPPDLIVFYHGANDLGVICRQLALGIEADGLGNPLLEPAPEQPVVACVDQVDSTGRLLASAVSRSMNQARAAAGSIPVVEFWQPFAATRRSTPTDGPLLERLGVDEADRIGQAAPYRAALQYMDPAPVDLTDSLDGLDGPIFFDWAHTNELGAATVAQAMWDRSLRDQVDALDATATSAG